MMCLVFFITRIELTIIVIIVIFVHDNNCIAKYQYHLSLVPIYISIYLSMFVHTHPCEQILLVVKQSAYENCTLNEARVKLEHRQGLH